MMTERTVAGDGPTPRLVLKHFSELTGPELYGILQLRSAVFVLEQDCVYLDLDGIDTLPQTWHAFYPHPDSVPAADEDGAGIGDGASVGEGAGEGGTASAAAESAENDSRDELPGRPFRDSHGNDHGRDLMPLAYARVLPHGFPDGPAGAPDARSIGRVVTAPAARGTGLGKRLMRELVERFGTHALVLNGQSHLQEYYAGFGFAPSGPDFDEDGIPHTPMRREGLRKHPPATR